MMNSLIQNSTLKPINKIPGVLQKDNSQKYVEDLVKVTMPRLLELKQREEHLLGNKSRLQRLPDKGTKVKEFYDKILKEIKTRDDIENTANLFSELNLTSSGHEKLVHLEWSGECKENVIILDSDDSDVDVNPLKIIAKSMNPKKKIKILPPEKNLITNEDLEEIKSFNSVPLNQYSLNLMEKSHDNLPENEKFKPYKTTKSNVHNPDKEVLRKVKKNWEVTAATPPFIQHPGVKMITLQDSVDIQIQYLNNLKALQEKNATERLLMKKGRMDKIFISEKEVNEHTFKKYREIQEEIEELEEFNFEETILEDEVN